MWIFKRDRTVRHRPFSLPTGRRNLVSAKSIIAPFPNPLSTRDRAVRDALERAGVEVRTYKDRVVLEGGEVRTVQGGAYTVFTPYRRAWWRCYRAEPPGGPSHVELPRPSPPRWPVRGGGRFSGRMRMRIRPRQFRPAERGRRTHGWTRFWGARRIAITSTGIGPRSWAARPGCRRISASA